jgi:hypothetical protein
MYRVIELLYTVYLRMIVLVIITTPLNEKFCMTKIFQISKFF